MALEDLTGPAKFIDSFVVGNPVSNDDRREGDDHIRGIKNVLRNTFPNLNAAVTLSDEQINAVTGALMAANNLADVPSDFVALQNLGIQDAQGRWYIPKPLALGPTLHVTGWDEIGAPIVAVVNAVAGEIQAYLANLGNTALVGNKRAGGSIGLSAADFVGLTVDGLGRTVLTQKPGATGSGVNIKQASGCWALRIDGDSGLLLLLFQPGGSGKYLSVQVDANLSAPTFKLAGAGAGTAVEVVVGANGVRVADAATPTIIGAQPADTSNDASIATTAFVHAHTALGAGQWYLLQASPAFGTAYQNNTNKPRFVSVILNITTAGDYRLEVSQDNSTYALIAQCTMVATGQTLQALVPPGAWYRVRQVSGVATITGMAYSG